LPTLPTLKQYLPEQIITFSGRWVSVRQFDSGDIAVKVVKYDPDLVSLVKSVAKRHGARYNPQYRTWNVPRFAARAVRRILEEKARTMEISMDVARDKSV
jgi:competence protein CoiA